MSHDNTTASRHDASFHPLKDNLAYVSQLMAKLAKLNTALFNPSLTHIDYNASVGSQPRLGANTQLNILAWDFIDALDRGAAILIDYPIKPHTKQNGIRAYPWDIGIFFDCVNECNLLNIADPQYRQSSYSVRDLNHCVDMIQREMTDLEIMQKRQCTARKHRQQQHVVKDYITSLFTNHARLMVLRLDFGYRSHIEDVSYSVVMRHLTQLTRYLRERHTHNAHVGFIWKLEYGLKKGYHLHMMIFMDGSQVQQSISHGKMICDHWNDKITKGIGTSYNCNAKMDDYLDCGIGTIDYYNERKINSLLRASIYLTKHDPYIEIMQEIESSRVWDAGQVDLSRQIMNGRVFGKGQIAQRSISDRGRPRRKLMARQ